MGAGDVAWGSRRRGGRKRGRAPGAALPLRASALSHGDGAPGAGAEDCITSARRLWRAKLGNRPRRRPTRRRASPAPLFLADGGDLSVGLIHGGEEEGGGVRSGPGAARTILLFHYH